MNRMMRDCLAVFVGLAPTVSPAAVVVSLQADRFDAGATNGCSLREAVQAVNLQAQFAGCIDPVGTWQRIELPDNPFAPAPRVYVLSRQGADEDDNVSGDLDLRRSVEIVGSGPTPGHVLIDGSGLGDRLIHAFRTGPGVIEIGLANLSLSGGAADAQGQTEIDGAGGAVLAREVWLHGRDLIVHGNRASLGGGIACDGLGSQIRLQRVAVFDNTASARGGGLYVGRDQPAELVNVTVSGNRAVGAGGGLRINTSLAFNNVTIAGNHAGGDGGGVSFNDLGGLGLQSTLRNSVLAGNSAGASGADLHCNAPLSHYGHLAIGSFDCPLQALTGAGALLIGADARLTPLWDYGAEAVATFSNLGQAQAVPVHALMPDSPLRTLGNSDGNAQIRCADEDARGRSRPVSGACSVGAYQFHEDFVVDTLVDLADANPGDGLCLTSAGTCSLRASLQEADARPGTVTEITLPAGTHLLSVASDWPQFGGGLELRGGPSRGVLLRGAGPGNTVIRQTLAGERVLLLPGGSGVRSAALLGLELTGGQSSVHGGGAIWQRQGRLLLYETELRGNIGGAGGGAGGGGLRSTDHTQTWIERSAVVDNSAGHGGGIEASGSGQLTVRHSTVAGNRAQNPIGGGGLYVQGLSLHLAFSTVAHNRALSVHGGSGGLALSTTPGTGAELWASVVGDNRASHATTGADCANPAGNAGNLVLLGYSLIGSALGCGHVHAPDAIGNGVDLATRLAAPYRSEGPTAAAPPQPNSPALDAIALDQCRDARSHARQRRDQHGAPRPGAGPALCDIGAFEGISDRIFANGLE